MSGGGFTVDPDELAEFVAALARFGRALESVQADVQGRMNRVHAVWRGVAADEHEAAHARWRAGSEQAAKGLRTMRTVASTAGANYTAALRVNGALWSGR